MAPHAHTTNAPFTTTPTPTLHLTINHHYSNISSAFAQGYTAQKEWEGVCELAKSERGEGGGLC